MTKELRAKFVDARGYWIPIKDIAEQTAQTVTLHNGRVFEL
jgi:hypothetical protein